MTTITTRSGKGSPLTNNEVDANFTNLNDDKIEASGDSMTGNLSFGDNNKAIFGDGSDLQIYHDANDSYISEQGSGNLKLLTDEFRLRNAADSAHMLTGSQGGAITAYHNGSAKLATSSTGIDVTGTAVTDGVTVDGVLGFVANASFPTTGLVLYTNNYLYQRGGSSGIIFSDASGTNEISRFTPATVTFNEDSNDQDFRVESNALTHALFVDAGNNTVNIGRSSGPAALNVQSDSGADGIAVYGRSSDEISQVTMYNSGGTGLSQLQTRPQYFDIRSLADVPVIISPNASGKFYVYSGETVVNENSADHDFRVESNSETHMLFVDAGNDRLLIGKTAADTGVVGTQFRPDGLIAVTRDGDVTGIFNRKTSDGNILTFRKDNTDVGALGTNGGDLFVGTGDTNLLFADGSNRIMPVTTGGATVDKTIDLGTNGGRFKDAYFAGVDITNDSDRGRLRLWANASLGGEMRIFNANGYGFIGMMENHTLNFHTNNVERLELGSGEAVFNDVSNDIDFRVESNNISNMLFVDAGNDTMLVANNITMSANEIDVASGDLTVDVAGDIILDADGAQVRFRDGGTEFFKVSNESGFVQLYSPVSNSDIKFDGNDGGSAITALTLDMSDAGFATFNNGARATTLQARLQNHGGDVFVSANQTGNAYLDLASTASLILGATGTATHNSSKIVADHSIGSTGDHRQMLTFHPVAGNSLNYEAFRIRDTEIVANETGSSAQDFRVESDGNSNMIFVDASIDSIGIGTGSPSSTYALDIAGAVRSSGNAPGYTLLESDASNQQWIVGSYGGTLALRDVTGGTYPFQITTGAPTNSILIQSGGVTVNDNSADQDFRVESDANSHAFFVDAGAGEVNVGTPTGPDAFNVLGKFDNAGFYRNYSGVGTAATYVKIGRQDTNGDLVDGVRIVGGGDDAVEASHNGYFNIEIRNSGTYRSLISALTSGNEFVVNNDSHDMDFRVESNNDANAFVVNAGTDNIGMGTNNPAFSAGGGLRIERASTATLRLQSTGTHGLEIRAEADTAVFYSANNRPYHFLDSDSNQLFVIASDGSTFNDAVTITTADNTHQLKLISTDADSNVGPVLELFRDSASPADGDGLGRIYFYGNNSADEKVEYALIRTNVSDVTDATEDSTLEIFTYSAGAQASKFRAAPTETVLNESSKDVDFRVESDSNTHAVFVDAGNSRVGINESGPDQALSVNGIIQAKNDSSISLAPSASGTVITPPRGYSYINVSRTDTTAYGLLLLVFRTSTTLVIVSTVDDRSASKYSASVSGTGLVITNDDSSTKNFYASCVCIAFGAGD